MGKHKRNISKLLAVCIVTVLLIMIGERILNDRELQGAYEVVKVTDGDTIIVRANAENLKVRLIGIDTPESVHPDQTKNTPEGREVKKWLDEFLEEEKVYLEFDIAKEDHYSRKLAYVYLSDKKTMLNRLLVQKGLARILTVSPNIKYADELQADEKIAQENKKGFWGKGFF